jgi:hypothetical protein
MTAMCGVLLGPERRHAAAAEHRDPGVEETALVPATPGQTYDFRYRHLRLLIEGKDRMFPRPRRLVGE